MKRVIAIAVFTFLVCGQASAGTTACVLPVADGGDVEPSPASEMIAGSGLALQQPSLTQHSSGAAQKAAQPAWLYVGLLMP